MRLGIDASNIRAGGGVIHLVELLRAADMLPYGFSHVVVWAGHNTLAHIEDRPWLVKSHQPFLDAGIAHRIWWQGFELSKLTRASRCDMLFLPGGFYVGDFRPIVTMSQNLLPFELDELRRYGLSMTGLRLMLLRLAQSNTFRRADGIIFLTEYARNSVMKVIGNAPGKTRVINHGVVDRFSNPPREQLAISQYSVTRPFRILYVSNIDLYKHQWHVAEAVAQLRRNGLPVVLELIGPAYPPALTRLYDALKTLDPGGLFIHYLGDAPYSELHARYTSADLCLFASSCETFGQILTESMSAGLPIACSNRSAMPELLGDAGLYFNPEDPNDIAHALRELINSHNLRAKLAKASFERAQVYSWTRCANETFAFLAEIATAFYEKRKPKRAV